MMFVHTKIHTSRCTVNTKDLNLIMKLEVYSCPCTAKRALVVPTPREMDFVIMQLSLGFLNKN